MGKDGATDTEGTTIRAATAEGIKRAASAVALVLFVLLGLAAEIVALWLLAR